VPRNRAGHVERFAVRFGPRKALLDHRVERCEARHVGQLLVDRLSRVEFEQAPGAVVGEEYAALVVDRDDALDHAGKDFAQLLAVVFQQPEHRRQSTAHRVERLGQFRVFGPAANADHVAEIALGQFPRALVQLDQRAREPPREKVSRADRGEEYRADRGRDLARQFVEHVLGALEREQPHQHDGGDDEQQVREEEAPKHGNWRLQISDRRLKDTTSFQNQVRSSIVNRKSAI
jgi:hypothetical protein